MLMKASSKVASIGVSSQTTSPSDAASCPTHRLSGPVMVRAPSPAGATDAPSAMARRANRSWSSQRTRTA